MQAECDIINLLTIPLHSNVHWGTVDGMLVHAYLLHQPINLFVNSADELFSPITTIHQPGMPVKRIPWTDFSFQLSDWERINNARTIILDANSLQQVFSSDCQATLWQAIPTFKELQSAWEKKLTLSAFCPYKEALECGLAKIHKYYTKFDEKPAYVLVLSMSTACAHLNLVN